MAFDTHFTSATFDTSGNTGFWVISDANGLIDPGPMTSPVQLGYTAPNMDIYLAGLAASIGLQAYVYDIPGQFPGATYYYGVSYGVSGPSGTTVYVDNRLTGTSASEVIFDPQGDNVYVTRGGDDLVFSGGTSAVKSGGGDDVVITASGNDTVDAGGGSDFVFLWTGDDHARGGGGHDEIRGGGGNDGLEGQGGRDTLLGEAGEDTLLGGRGRDRLDGGTEADTLEGGAGRDTFVYRQAGGTDVITDFEAGRDRLELDAAFGATTADLAPLATSSGTDLILTFGAGETLTLLDTTWLELSTSQVDFA